MDGNEYFSNLYISLIKNNLFHIIITLFEYIFTFSIQILIFTRKLDNESDNQMFLPPYYYQIIMIDILHLMPKFLKLVIILLLSIIVIIYYFIYSKFSFNKNNIVNKIIINIFEVFLFRLFLIFFIFGTFSIEDNFIFLIAFIFIIPVIIIIINSLRMNHLYYFSPHFVIYPYDCFSSLLDLFHIIEKIFICISLQTSINSLKKFLFIIVFFLQLFSLFLSIYVLNFKSYYIMSNIFLNNARFSFLISLVISNFIVIFLGKKNITASTFIMSIYIFVIFFIIFQTFYNPYNYASFDTDENIENLFIYFYIIDQLKNDCFILEEKLDKHYDNCKNCNFCTNLKHFLNNKANYNKLYKILYKGHGMLSKIMNELIYSLLINKNKYNNKSYYLINIIYCYYIYLNKKEYVLSSNLKIIYEILNEDNKNNLESYSISTGQILLINEFLFKADKILDNIIKTVIEKDINKKVQNFFYLFRNIYNLKNKKFKRNLYYNKNEGIINFFRYISICTMIYEEIFNTTISTTGITLKENQIFLDNLSNKNNSTLNEIIIQLDLLNLENKIIYVIGEFSKYKNRALCQLFPNIFRSKQLMMIKKKLSNLKNFENDINDKNTPFNEGNNKNMIEQFINFHCVIKDKNKEFKLINLSLFLIYQLKMTRQILLAGIYSIEKNIIITLDKSTKEKSKELILNTDERNFEEECNNNIFIKYKRDNKYYNNQKLFFINRYFINPNYYNIYKIIGPKKQKTHKDEVCISSKASMKNLLLYLKDDNHGESDGKHNFSSLIQSASASTFAQTTFDNNNFKKRNKSGKKNIKKNNNFLYLQISIVILAILILLCQSIIYKITKNKKLFNDSQNLILMNLKNFYGVFNHLFTSSISLACIADRPKGNNCISMLGIFEEFYANYFHNNINSTLFIQRSNKFSSNSINRVKHLIIEALSLSDDQEIIDLVNSKILIYFSSQNITQNNINLVLQTKYSTLLEVLDYMINSFIIMSSKYEYIKERVYIINRVIPGRENFTFVNVKMDDYLTQFQNHFYYIILNYQTFIKKLDIIINKLIKKTNYLGHCIIKFSYFFSILNSILYILLIVVLLIYIRIYCSNIIDLLGEIDRKMNLKNENISVNEMFLQKIEKLKIIVSLYKQDIYQAIVDLNFIYDNYKKFIEEKNKEMAKYLKKDRYNDSNFNSRKKLFKKIKIKHILNIPENKRHLYYLSFILLFCLLLNAMLYYLWSVFNSDFVRINNLIKCHGILSVDSYKLVSYYQLMIYSNITIEDINHFENYNKSNSENIFSTIYKDLQSLYNAKKLMKSFDNYNLDNIDFFFNFTCKTYYEYLFKNDLYLATIEEKDKEYKEVMEYFCEASNIFNSNNYKQIFSIFFEMIQIGMNEINDRSYTSLISIMHTNNFPIIIAYFLTVYNYAIQILDLRVQKQSYVRLHDIMKENIFIGYVFNFITSTCLILIIFFEYIWNINKDYKKIHELKKVFKICNKKE